MIFPVNHLQPLNGNNSVFTERDLFWMEQALSLAKMAFQKGEVPVGAVLVLDDQQIGEGHNAPISCYDPTAHAEIMALRTGANKLGNYRLINTTLYTTLEPCMMCAGAIVHSRVKRLVYGATDPKAGAIASKIQSLDHPFLNHRTEHIGGLLAAPCRALLTQFFKNVRCQIGR